MRKLEGNPMSEDSGRKLWCGVSVGRRGAVFRKLGEIKLRSLICVKVDDLGALNSENAYKLNKK